MSVKEEKKNSENLNLNFESEEPSRVVTNKKYLRKRQPKVVPNKEEIFLNCHQCHQIRPLSQLLTCLNSDCRESYCLDCVKKYYLKTFHRGKTLRSVIKEAEKDSWECYKCRNGCKCFKCSPFSDNLYHSDIFLDPDFNSNFASSNSNSLINIKRQKDGKLCNNNKKIFYKKRSPSDDSSYNIEDSFTKLDEKHRKIGNSFKRNRGKLRRKSIEENSSEEYKVSEESEKDSTSYSKRKNDNIRMRHPIVNNGCHFFDLKDDMLIQSLTKGVKTVKAVSQQEPQNKLSKIEAKLHNKLSKVADLCEHFYKNKCKGMYLKKECLICHTSAFHVNELLRFKNSDDFISYCRYLFLDPDIKNLIEYNKNNFDSNKRDICEFNKRKETWSFRKPKIVCKFCLIKCINEEKCLSLFQKILVDSDSLLGIKKQKKTEKASEEQEICKESEREKQKEKLNQKESDAKGNRIKPEEMKTPANIFDRVFNTKNNLNSQVGLVDGFNHSESEEESSQKINFFESKTFEEFQEREKNLFQLLGNFRYMTGLMIALLRGMNSDCMMISVLYDDICRVNSQIKDTSSNLLRISLKHKENINEFFKFLRIYMPVDFKILYEEKLSYDQMFAKLSHFLQNIEVNTRNVLSYINGLATSRGF